MAYFLYIIYYFCAIYASPRLTAQFTTTTERGRHTVAISMGIIVLPSIISPSTAGEMRLASDAAITLIAEADAERSGKTSQQSIMSVGTEAPCRKPPSIMSMRCTIEGMGTVKVTINTTVVSNTKRV